jgi:NADH-quinone oxidoreductase subunit L
MGGLRAKMPTTYRTFVVATLAIAGIFPFAGFFSKDEILWGAWSAGHPVIWGLLAVAALLTAFYMARLAWLVFFGANRGERERFEHAHESPRSMTIPLVILAAGSAAAGLVGLPAVLTGGRDWNLLHHWLAPAVHGPESHGSAHGHATELLLILLALGLAVGGILLGVQVYRRAGLPERLARASGPLYVLVRNLYWVDELYEALVVRPYYRLSRISATFDRFVIDGLVNATGVTLELIGQIVKLFQTGFVRNYALVFLLGVVAILYYLASL